MNFYEQSAAPKKSRPGPAAPPPTPLVVTATYRVLTDVRIPIFKMYLSSTDFYLYLNEGIVLFLHSTNSKFCLRNLKDMLQAVA